MAYGLSYEDFWYGDLYKARYCLKAYKERLKLKDMELWEMGMYVYEALLEAAPALRPFSKAKKPLPYTEKPHTMQTEEQDREPTEQEIENEKLKAELWARQWVRQLNKNKQI